MKLINLTLAQIIPTLMGLAFILPTPSAQGQAFDRVPLVEKNPDVRAYFLESSYDYAMRMGYQATERENYSQALTYFKDALYLRPENEYANTAYYNVLSLYLENRLEEPEPSYDSYMEAGYEAVEAGAYYLALIHFDQALQERPSDEYALEAVDNVEGYLDLNS